METFLTTLCKLPFVVYYVFEIPRVWRFRTFFKSFNKVSCFLLVFGSECDFSVSKNLDRASSIGIYNCYKQIF